MTRVSAWVRRLISSATMRADAAVARLAVGVLVHDRLAGRAAHRFGDHHDAEVAAAPTALLDLGADPVERVGDLRDQDHVGAAGDARREGDVAGIAAHHLEHHDPRVAGGGDVQAIDRLGRHLDRRAEADRALGVAEIVVDRLRDADQAPVALLRQPAQDREAAVAADADQRAEAELVVAVDDLVRAVDRAAVGRRIGERIAAVGRAEHGAAEVQDAGDAVRGQLDRVDRAPEQAVGRLADPEHLPAVAEHRALDHRPDHGVQAGAVPAARQQTDPHRASWTT